MQAAGMGNGFLHVFGASWSYDGRESSKWGCWGDGLAVGALGERWRAAAGVQGLRPPSAAQHRTVLMFCWSESR